MRKSMMVAAFAVTGAGAAGASAALPVPYQGSDTEYDLTTQAIKGANSVNPTLITPLNSYIGGGSGNAIAVMSSASPTQYTGPMSRMIKSEANVCVNSGANATGAAGIVLGLDAVDVLSSTLAGGQASCNGAAGASGDNTGLGLAYGLNSSNALPAAAAVFSKAPTTANPMTWKWVLGLIYGGHDFSNSSAAVDCNSTARQNLVANWSLLFQQGCSFASGAAICNDTTHGGALWHAFRRDDVAGTADAFASIIGLTPSISGAYGETSTISTYGFGATPYCNAMNWDVSINNVNVSNSSYCYGGVHSQFLGPGGVPDSTDPTHRMPPPGVWGAAPDTSQLKPTKGSWDVLPTSYQDNDPIRRPCIGATVKNTGIAGEQICNIDNNLGLVLPINASDWLLSLSTPLKQYPTNNCTGAFVLGAPPTVFTCAPSGVTHSGECPNGDSLFAGGCLVPIDSTNDTSQCLSNSTNVTAIQVRTNLANGGNPDGRIYNITMRDGSVSNNGTLPFLQYNIAALSTAANPVTVDFWGGSGRIHSTQTILPGTAVPCQEVDVDDAIGCITQADPCSIGFSGDNAKTWNQRSPITAASPGTDAARLDEIYPVPATVQLLGQAGEYQFARKLYFSSFIGFQNIPNNSTSGTGTGASELYLANWEATDSNINPLLSSNGFFTFDTSGGPQYSPGGAGTTGLGAQFCEDFNESNICDSGKSTNNNACATINSAISSISNTANTVCGNGIVEAYEECDDGANQTAKGIGHCSSTCRCTTQSLGASTTAGGDNGCQ